MPLLNPNTIFARRYRLVKHLGTGAFAEVWKAEDTLASNTVIAIKIYAPDKGMDQDGLKIFRNEYALPYSLKHTNLLTAKHFDVYNGSPYLVMNYCEEGSLMRRLVNKHTFTENELANILKQIGNALDYVHKSGLCHKDIKPENILIENQDTYVLADFGISSRIRRTIMQNMAADKHQARYLTFTPAFAPPESHKSPPAPSGDIFSLGATLYELAAGKLPFEQMGKAVSEGAFMPQLPSSFTNSFYQLLLQCMDIDPKVRPTALELHESANHYLKKGQWLLGDTPSHNTVQIPDEMIEKEPETQEVKRPLPTDKAGTSSSKSKAWLFPLLALLILSGVIASYFYWSNAEKSSPQWTLEELFPNQVVSGDSIHSSHRQSLLHYINKEKAVPTDWRWDTATWQVVDFGLANKESSIAAFSINESKSLKNLVILSTTSTGKYQLEKEMACQNCTSLQLIDKGEKVILKDTNLKERIHKAKNQEIKVIQADGGFRLLFQEDNQIEYWSW